MPQTNENSHFECRFLDSDLLSTIHQTFIAGFADYLIKFQLTEEQFKNHIRLNAVDLDRSIGCFDGEQLVAVSLNGFGDWEGKPTTYDAGTTVRPEYRRRGISRAMFDEMIPKFAGEGFEQFLLEVLTENEPAVNLYRSLGFHTTRELLLLQADSLKMMGVKTPGSIEIREIHRHESIPYESFWDGKPSWQNSSEAIERSLRTKRLFGAFDGDECVGYIIFSAGMGRLAQLAVRRDYRRNGIATRLLLEMQKDAGDNKLQVINLDESLTESVVFFRNRGFKKLLGQFEMVRSL